MNEETYFIKEDALVSTCDFLKESEKRQETELPEVDPSVYIG